uniref:Peptidase S1 domain-containing protein n=1 Tax=Steinernema glaseri TaxID=37863 RepID=A0A1I7Y9D3_9BILA
MEKKIYITIPKFYLEESGRQSHRLKVGISSLVPIIMCIKRQEVDYSFTGYNSPHVFDNSNFCSVGLKDPVRESAVIAPGDSGSPVMFFDKEAKSFFVIAVNSFAGGNPYREAYAKTSPHCAMIKKAAEATKTTFRCV